MSIAGFGPAGSVQVSAPTAPLLTPANVLNWLCLSQRKAFRLRMFCMSQLLGLILTAFLPFSCMVKSVPPNWFNINSRVTIYSILRAMQQFKFEMMWWRVSIYDALADESLSYLQYLHLSSHFILRKVVFSIWHFLHIWNWMDGTYSRNSLLILLWCNYFFLQWL